MTTPEFNPSDYFLDAACKALALLADRVQEFAQEARTKGVPPNIRMPLTRMLPSLKSYVPGLDVPKETPVSIALREGAFEALAKERPLEALQLALRGLAMAPHDSRLWHAAGLAHLQGGLLDSAEQLLNHAQWCNLANTAVKEDLEKLRLNYGGYGACAIPDAPSLEKASFPTNDTQIALNVTNKAASACTITDLGDDLGTLANSISTALVAHDARSTFNQITGGLSLVLERLRDFPPRPEETVPTVETQLSHGDALYLLEQNHHPIAALWMTLKALSRAPHNPALWHITAIICLELNSTEHCRAILEHVLWIDPQCTAAQEDLDGLVGFREEPASGVEEADPTLENDTPDDL
ncbi:MAG: hypothetical protein K1X83_13235 [Oligoflexia bacterium]|nr:hypothetical protein [Oligoflexia bacterium]